MNLFQPGWTMHPGVHLRDWLEYEKCPPMVFAKTAGIDRQKFDDLLACKRSVRITKDMAERIHHASCVLGIGPSAQFWRNADANYRADLKRGARDCSADYLTEPEKDR